MLTKNDLKAIKQLIDVSLNLALKDRPTKKDLIGLARGTEIDELKITFIDNLAKWKDELYTKIDSVLGRVKTAEEENTILEACQEEREKLVSRIKKLEVLHPGNRHAQI